MTANYRALREGLCPTHGTPLERRGDHGWCEACRVGWSMTPGEVTMHLEFSAGEVDGRPLGPGKLRVSREERA